MDNALVTHSLCLRRNSKISKNMCYATGKGGHGHFELLHGFYESAAQQTKSDTCFHFFTSRRTEAQRNMKALVVFSTYFLGLLHTVRRFVGQT
jgi:predicted ATPase